MEGLREEFSELAESRTRAAFDARVAQEARSALKAGLKIERNVMLYVAAAMALDPDFPGAYPGLLDILANEAVPFETRKEALLDAWVEAWGG